MTITWNGEQGKNFFHTRQNGQFVGDDRIEAPAFKEFFEKMVDGPPVPFDLAGHVDFLAEQVVRDGRRFGSDGHVERIGQGMGGVRAQDQGSQTGLGGAGGRGGGHGRFTHPAFAGEQQNPGTIRWHACW
jgi:hypothetical protein